MNTILVGITLATLVAVIVCLLVLIEVRDRRQERRQGEWFTTYERLLRAVLAKHAGEYGSLEQVASLNETRAEKARAQTEAVISRRPLRGKAAAEARTRDSLGDIDTQTPAQAERGFTDTVDELMAKADA